MRSGFFSECSHLVSGIGIKYMHKMKTHVFTKLRKYTNKYKYVCMFYTNENNNATKYKYRKCAMI